jgi:hypothetical protein
MPEHVFISHSARDKDKANEISEHLELSGIRCWIAPRDIAAGTSYGDGISDAVRTSAAVLLVLSVESNRSHHVAREVELALEHRLPVLPVLIQAIDASEAMFLIRSLQWIDLSEDRWRSGLKMLADSLTSLVPQIEQGKAPVKQKPPGSTTKGYVFISYNRDDGDFILRLKAILKRRWYAYWDYSESERDYHSALYKELEEKIENAKAFMCVVTDNWRESEWPAAEYIYAREAKVPVFVIQAKTLARPVPIIINQQTRIDMVSDFVKGALVLGLVWGGSCSFRFLADVKTERRNFSGCAGVAGDFRDIQIDGH